MDCEVSSVYPSEYFEVQWLDGDKVLKTDEENYGTDVLRIPYIFTPSSVDDGKAITCRATLYLDGVPLDEMTKETSGRMKVLCKLYLHILTQTIFK